MAKHSILAMCGSLREGSTNAALLQAARFLASADVDVQMWNGQGSLPQFIPDFEDSPPGAVL